MLLAINMPGDGCVPVCTVLLSFGHIRDEMGPKLMNKTRYR